MGASRTRFRATSTRTQSFQVQAHARSCPSAEHTHTHTTFNSFYRNWRERAKSSASVYFLRLCVRKRTQISRHCLNSGRARAHSLLCVNSLSTKLCRRPSVRAPRSRRRRRRWPKKRVAVPNTCAISANRTAAGAPARPRWRPPRPPHVHIVCIC